MCDGCTDGTVSTCPQCPPLVLIPTWHMVTPSPQSQLSTPCSHLRTPRPMSRSRNNGRRQRRSESRRSEAPRPRAHHTQYSDRAGTECVLCYTRRKEEDLGVYLEAARLQKAAPARSPPSPGPRRADVARSSRRHALPRRHSEVGADIDFRQPRIWTE